MAFEWSEYAFGELCTITRGASPRPINAFLSKTGMPWIKIADATSSDSRFLEKTNECIKLEGVKSSVRVFPGDLILSNSATPGLPKFVMLEACIHDGWMLLRNFNGLNKSFAYWLLLNERKNLVAQGNGSVFTNLKTDILKLHRVRVPELATQAKIAQILDSIAAKVDLNRRINKTLEAMAQAIFKSWFVDFDPVKAKITAIEQGQDPLRAAMRAISGKTDFELDQMPRAHHDQLAATAALFPDAMEESELGEIPKGWEVSTIGEMVEIAGGATPDTKNESYWNPPEYFWTSPKDLSGAQSPVLLTTERKISTAGLSRIGSGLLPKGTLLMSSRAPIGYLAITQIPVAINQGYIAMLPGGKLPPLYLLMWCQQNMEEIKGQANGSTFMEISKKAFRPMLVTNPGSVVLDRFIETVTPLFGKLAEGVKESSQLAKLRDTLLPKLLSGELSVADVEIPA